MSIPKNNNLLNKARKLRKEMTKEEKQLWYRFLREYPVHFKRQVTCKDYILDFYCPNAKLAVELDGSYHRASQVAEKDRIRTEYLNSVGILVMRFPNRDIWHNLDRVCNQIDYMVRERINSLSDK